MSNPNKNLLCQVPSTTELLLTTVLTLSCSTGLQTASAGGTGSVQSDAAHAEQSKSQTSGGSFDAQANQTLANKSSNYAGSNQTPIGATAGTTTAATTGATIGATTGTTTGAASGAASGAAADAAASVAITGSSNQAIPPTNIVGNLEGGQKDGPPPMGGQIPNAPQNIGVSEDHGTLVPGGQPTGVGAGPGTGGPASNGTEQAMTAVTYVSSNATISCSRSLANPAFFWDGICTVIAADGTALDLATATTSHSWTIATPPGCDPLRTEHSTAGIPSHLIVTYIRSVPESCLTGSTVSLQAVTYHQERIMLSGALVP